MDVYSKTLKPCSSRVTLPMELIFSCILSKLPAKSLLRFKCVSKSFLKEISSPKFNKLFSEAYHRFLILPGKNESFSIYELDSLHSPPTICPYPIPSQWYAPHMSMVASCESCLLIGCGFTNLEGLILVNPTTRIYRVLPKDYVPPYSVYVQHGMCHCLDDESNDDLKIVRFFQYEQCPQAGTYYNKVMIYSLSTNLWKSVECKQTRSNQGMDFPVLVQNHLLVMILYEDRFYGNKMKIGCFDTKAERWSNDVLLPDILLREIESNVTKNHVHKYGGSHYNLGVLDGRLRLSCYNRNKLSYSVWVMKDYGVKESWFKLMSLPVEAVQEVYHPIAYRRGSLHELLCLPNSKGEFKWYNLRDKQMTKTGFDSNGLKTNFLSFAHICKRSLLNFPGGKLIPPLSKEQEVDDYDYCRDYDSDYNDDDDED